MVTSLIYFLGGLLVQTKPKLTQRPLAFKQGKENLLSHAEEYENSVMLSSHCLPTLKPQLNIFKAYFAQNTKNRWSTLNICHLVESFKVPDDGFSVFFSQKMCLVHIRKLHF